MRSSRFQLQSLARRWSVRRPSFTIVLVAFSVATAATHWTAFALTEKNLYAPDSLIGLLGLGADSAHGSTWWQFLTFALIHANVFHLLGNMVPLYFAGREVEPIMGPKNFLGLYLLATLLGGFVQWGAMAGGFAPPGMILVGVSAGVAAIVGAFATILPELEVAVFFLPLRVRAKRFIPALVLLAATVWFTEVGSAIGPLAILVGTLIGWAYAKQLGFGNPLGIERFFLERRLRAIRLERMPVDQFIAEEIDPVLEKLGRCGMRGLSRAEKRTLQRGSAKLAEKR